MQQCRVQNIAHCSSVGFKMASLPMKSVTAIYGSRQDTVAHTAIDVGVSDLTNLHLLGRAVVLLVEAEVFDLPLIVKILLRVHLQQEQPACETLLSETLPTKALASSQ